MSLDPSSNAGGSYDAASGTGRKQVRVGGSFQPHFLVQRTDYKLANGDGAAFGEERFYSQIGVNSLNFRRINGAVWFAGDTAI